MGRNVELPRMVKFQTYPEWLGFNPTGYCKFSPGASQVSAGAFDSAEQGGTHPNGDIVLEMGDQGKMCLDIEQGIGKIRRWFFLYTQN